MPSGHPPPTRCLQPGKTCHLCGHSIKWSLHAKAHAKSKERHKSTSLITEHPPAWQLKNLSTIFWSLLSTINKYMATNAFVKKKEKSFQKWKLPRGNILLWKQYLKIPLMFWPIPSATCAVTIFIKPVMGQDMLPEERCSSGSHGHMLMCHTFTEIKTRKHFMFLSVLFTHKTQCRCAHSTAMSKCCLNSVPPTTSIKSTNRGAGEEY